MPGTPIATPEPTTSVGRATLAITSTRDASAPSWGGGVMYDGFANCSVSEDA